MSSTETHNNDNNNDNEIDECIQYSGPRIGEMESASKASTRDNVDSSVVHLMETRDILA